MFKYLIVYNYNQSTYLKTTDSYKNLILAFANFTSINTPLFVKAIDGCKSVVDCVEMYNYFCGADMQCEINYIHEISYTLYDENDNNKVVNQCACCGVEISEGDQICSNCSRGED